MAAATAPSSQDYQTHYDGAIVSTNQAPALPTGLGTLAHRHRLPQQSPLVAHRHLRLCRRHAARGGPVFGPAVASLADLFGEPAPLLPAHWMPNGIRDIDHDFGARYVASSSGAEANRPGRWHKISFAHGNTLRSSVATTNRFSPLGHGRSQHPRRRPRAQRRSDRVSTPSSTHAAKNPTPSPRAMPPTADCEPSRPSPHRGCVYHIGQSTASTPRPTTS
ncbi:MAG: hypothetical protein IPP19_05720 [Verrucomicrobia bacterium]|nr:hypothetical protein [Verrucomicrobiota bacterium]